MPPPEFDDGVEPAAKRARLGPGAPSVPALELAYLGPEGTYGEQAARRFAHRLGVEVSLVPCKNIAAIYAHPAPFLCMPFENTLQGTVLETVDCLLSPLATKPRTPAAYRRPVAIADTVLRIDHQLVARRGVTIDQVAWVRSHEQALGQSSAFLDAYLPAARRVPWPSTAGAVASLFDAPNEPGAALCSGAAYERDKWRLELLYSGTQAVKDNFTRFLLLTRLPDIPVVPQPHGYGFTSLFACADPRALVASHAQRSNIVVATHQRPAPPNVAPEPFPRWVLAEVYERDPEQQDVGGTLWLGTFEMENPRAADAVQAAQPSPFHAPSPFQSPYQSPAQTPTTSHFYRI
ncbi:Bifunctional chorismate mutase/prephenate dehydratase [Vanrija pseudolonga]|uniref:Bifunctional chorismate mutase/prephenate dehydratase n=1 Tax=Vanrija pseudolonga TaxID=143232 RepID=A0AAF1BJR8_9TREE|nr:Bifunctional chorismate mutase/prephenate dehydratase [Vanrija pseudolonga]